MFLLDHFPPIQSYFPDCVTHTSNQASIYMHACMLSRFSCVRLCVTPWTIAPPGSSVYGDSSGKTTRVGCHALLQGIFPSQRSNLLCLLHGQVGSLPLAPPVKPSPPLGRTQMLPNLGMALGLRSPRPGLCSVNKHAEAHSETSWERVL